MKNKKTFLPTQENCLRCTGNKTILLIGLRCPKAHLRGWDLVCFNMEPIFYLSFSGLIQGLRPANETSLQSNSISLAGLKPRISPDSEIQNYWLPYGSLGPTGHDPYVSQHIGNGPHHWCFYSLGFLGFFPRMQVVSSWWVPFEF